MAKKKTKTQSDSPVEQKTEGTKQRNKAKGAAEHAQVSAKNSGKKTVKSGASEKNGGKSSDSKKKPSGAANAASIAASIASAPKKDDSAHDEAMDAAVAAARESAVAKREAAATQQPASQQTFNPTEDVARARWGQFPGQNIGFQPGQMPVQPYGAPAAQQNAGYIPAPTVPLTNNPREVRGQRAGMNQPHAPAVPMQNPASMQAAPNFYQQQSASGAPMPAFANSGAYGSPRQLPGNEQHTPNVSVAQPNFAAQQAAQPVQQPNFAQPTQADQPPFAPQQSYPTQPAEGVTPVRTSHNQSMGEQIEFSPKEPGEGTDGDRKKRWGSPIKSLKDRVTALAGTDSHHEQSGYAAPVPEPEPEFHFQSSPIDYTPNPALLNNLPKFGGAPVDLPSPQELLASVPSITSTGQLAGNFAQPQNPFDAASSQGMPDQFYGQPEPEVSKSIAIPVFTDIPTYQVEVLSNNPQTPEQPIEVPPQDIVYGQFQVSEPYPPTDPYAAGVPYPAEPFAPVPQEAPIDFSQMVPVAFDPNSMYDPSAVLALEAPNDANVYGAPVPEPGFGYDANTLALPNPPQNYETSAYDPSQFYDQYDQMPNETYDSYSEYDYLETPVKGGKATASLITGILSILLALIPPVGIIFAILAILFSRSYYKKGGTAPRAGTGRVCGVVGLILSIILCIAYVVFVAYFYGGLYGKENAGSIMGYLQSTPLAQFL